VTTALANKQGQLAPLKHADPVSVLDRVLNEESTKDIAASFGVTRSALNYWLIQHCDKEWRAAQYIRAAKRKDEAEEELEVANDPLTLARAREKLRAAQWDLERVCRRIYGQDQPAQTANAVQVVINLRRESATNAVQHEPLAVIAEVEKA
jgi:hypothetical protein